MLSTYIIPLIILISQPEHGIIKGKIVDSETGDPLPVVNVILYGTTNGAITDIDGIYKIKDVKPGSYSVVARMMGYANVKVEDVKVNPGELTRVNFSLTPKAIQMKPVVIKAKRTKSTVAGLLSSQKKSGSISSGISSEEISDSPDSRASDVLKRVTGLTILEDKYVNVRGLSERYSNAQLNQSQLSSPEPDKRVVPFDIFPSGLLDNIVITKSFTPNLPGDFAGGSIKLTTREFTEKLFSKFNITYGYNSNTTFKSFDTYKGSRYDIFGFDNGFRALPSIIEQQGNDYKIVEGGQFGGGYSASEIENFGESFKNIWSSHIRKAPVNQSYSISGGNQFEVFQRPLGMITSISYKNNFSFREEERFYYIQGADSLEARHHYEDFEVSNMDVQLGGILNLSYKLSPLSKLGLKTTVTRTSDDRVVTYGMFPNRDHNLDEIATRLRWVERSLVSTELSGEHKISLFDSELNWRTNYSYANRNEPDTRETLYESEHGLDSFRLADESNSGSRFFSYLTDHNIDGGLNLEIPLRQWNSLPYKLKMGGSAVYKRREIDSRRFRFKPQDFNDVNIYQEPEEIFSPENIGPDGFQLSEDTRPTDNYKANQIISAGYMMVDIPLTRRMRFVGGARLEKSYQWVKTYDLFNPDASPVIGEVDNMDILPALNLSYKLTSDMKLRAALSQTVSRPSFRELSKFEFTDVGGHAVYGNPDLKRTLIQNYDLRWEMYPHFTEHISVAVFYKNFINPIEKTLEDRTEPVSTWENAEGAYNYGIELEVRKGLGFISSSLDDFNIAGNVSLIKSRVKLEDTGTAEDTRERTLQGQSPYVLNLSLKYKHPSLGTELTGLYNVFGPRITAVGISVTPDIYEEPFHKFDFVLTQPIYNKFKLKLKAQNVLDSEVKYTQGNRIQRHYSKGRSISAGLSYSL